MQQFRPLMAAWLRCPACGTRQVLGEQTISSTAETVIFMEICPSQNESPGDESHWGKIVIFISGGKEEQRNACLRRFCKKRRSKKYEACSDIFRAIDKRCRLVDVAPQAVFSPQLSDGWTAGSYSFFYSSDSR